MLEQSKPRSVPPIAIAAVAACSAIVPAMGVYRVVINATSGAQVVPAIVATVLIVPVQVYLVVAASRGHNSTRHRWALSAVAALVVAMTPVVGVTWLGAVFPLSALVLVVMPRPYGMAAFAGLVVAPIPLAYWFGAPNWAGYFAFGTLMFGLGVAVPIWLLAAVHELRQLRIALAEQAVVRERLRIDRELGPTVSSTLATIAESGEQAARLAETDPTGASDVLGAVVERSRRAMAEVRRVVHGYQAQPARAELRRMVRLLDAAGIRTRLVLPPGDLPATLDEGRRAALRARVADILSRDDIRDCVCTVIVRQGSVEIDLWTRESESRPKVTAA